MMELVERDDGWHVVPDGEMVVWQTSIDKAFGLTVANQETAEIRVEGSFEFAGNDETVRKCSPSDPQSLVGPVLLVHSACKSITVSKESVLSISFGSNGSITVPPDPNQEFESWRLQLHNGAMLVCLPGGELQAWPAIHEHEA
jgi:hypothetical protein